MRLLLLVLLLCCPLAFRAAAQVDTLSHRGSIRAFVARAAHLRKVELLAVNDIIRDSALVESSAPVFWYRADFNHDGTADLLVRVRPVRAHNEFARDELLVVTGGPKNAVIKLDNSFYTRYMHRVVSPILIQGRSYLVYSTLELHYTLQSMRSIRRLTHDTVFVVQNRPMLFTAHPGPAAQLKQLSYTTTQCFGTCPVFQVQIFPSRTVQYHGIYYTKRPGYYRLRLNQRDYAYLTLLLSRLRLPQLADQYEVDWTDDQTCYLRIEFADGQVKNIEDYGMQGTFGLALLYQFLWEHFQPAYLRLD